MLVLAVDDLSRTAPGRRRHRRDVGRGAARHRPRVRRGARRACAPSRDKRPAPPTCARCSTVPRSSPVTATAIPRVQDAYSLRCAPQVAGAARDALEYAERVAEAELRAAIDNPMVLPGRTCRVVRQLPWRAGRVRVRLPGDRRRRGRRDRRAAHRPAARPGALTRAAGVPGRGPGRQLGADDRPLRAGGDGRRESPARGPGERRLAADQRDAGGPRLDGLGRGPEAAPGGLRTSAAILAVELVCAARALDLRAPLRPRRRHGRRTSRRA